MARLVDWLTDDSRERSASPPPGVGRERIHPMAADALLALVLALISTPRIVQGGDGHPKAGLFMLECALLVPLVWRRRYPLTVFVWLCAVVVAQRLSGVVEIADVAVLMSLYTVATRCPRRIALVAAAAIEAGVAIATEQHVLGGSWARSMVYLTAMVCAAFFLGTNLRTRRQYLAALVERSERLEYERDQQARIAVAAERASIAREMHDIVAHSLAVVITTADAAALKARSDPDRAMAAMRQVSETGRQALSETRRLLGVLRTDTADGELAPQPGLAQLDALLDQVRATGLPAELVVTGRPFPVPEGAQLAAYRIVQEALTNTIKHATGAATVRVGVRYAEPKIEIDVLDDGHPEAPDPASDGHGLVGMQERALLYDGSVTAGRRPVGGWAVHARLVASASP